MVSDLIFHFMKNVDHARIVWIDWHKIYKTSCSSGLIDLNLLLDLLVELYIALWCFKFILEVKLFDLSVDMLHFQSHFIQDKVVLYALYIDGFRWQGHVASLLTHLPRASPCACPTLRTKTLVAVHGG